MRALHVAPGQEPSAVEIPAETDAQMEKLQKLVGGDFEILTLETITASREVVLICDEEARLKGSELNFWSRRNASPILGACVVAARRWTCGQAELVEMDQNELDTWTDRVVEWRAELQRRMS